MDNSYTVKHPKDKTLYRVLAYSMTWTSVGCQSWWGYPTPNKLLKNITSLFKFSILPIPILQSFFVYQHFNEIPFDTLGTIFCFTSIELIVNLKVLTTYYSSFKQVMKNFMGNYHIYNYHKDIEFNKKILNKIENFSQITAIAVFAVAPVAGFFYLFVTLVYNVNNREEITLNRTSQFQSGIYIQLPFDYLYDFNGMVINFVFNFFCVFIYSSFIAIFEIITYITIYNLVGHIVILKNEIKTKFTGNLSESEVKAGIVEIIDHHIFIIRAFKDVQSTYGLSVSGSYLNNLLTNSFFMYMIMFSEPANAVRYAFILIVFFGGSAIMSLIFEEIRIQCCDLSETLYGVPWEDMSISNQKSILIMLAQMQPPLIFVAAGGLVAGIQPLIFIVKTTFSYYVMLKSMV